jgi:tetratricopeptide (TPR) repeat protein
VIRGLGGVFFLSLSLGLPACGGESAVARVVDGHDIDGHFITPDAYAEFLDGALLEDNGDLRGAEAAYRRALDEDGGAAEVWARLGRVRCASNPRGSDEAFRQARFRGPSLGAVWRADAECALDRGDVPRARDAAGRAAAVDPGNAQASLLVVRALVRARELELAERWLRAARLLYPESAGLPASLAAVMNIDVARAGSPPAPIPAAVTPPQPGAPAVPAQTAAGTNVVPSTSPGHDAPERRDAMAALDAALMAGDAVAARNAAMRAHLDNAWLALRAVELGQPALAKEAAETTLAAEPGNVDARIAALAAADLGRDEAALRRYATKLPDAREPPSAFALRVMTALLARRAGTDAAHAFEKASAAPR